MSAKKSVFIVVAAAVLGTAFYFAWKRLPQPATGTSQPVITEEMQLEMDRKALANSSSTPHERYGAMIRLAQHHEDVSRTEALKRAGDTNALLRGGAAQALGYFDDAEASAALKKLLQDKEQSVRLFAVQGLGQKTDSMREQELEALLKTPEVSLEMRVEIYASLIKATKGQNKEAVPALLQIARDGDEAVNTEAAQRLVSLAPDDPRVLDLIRRKISAAKNERVTALGTRYLASRGDPWIRDVLKTLSAHPSPQIRGAVIQSLHRVCPADRWKLLENFLKTERDEPTMKLVLEEPIFLLGEPAVEFLNKALAAGLSPALKQVAQESLEKVKASGAAQELCANSAEAKH